MTGLLALACGVAVANVYFPQAITPLIAAGLHTGRGMAASAATTVQLGYAVGLFLLVPLGDRVPHRRLVVVLLAATAIALTVAGLAPNMGVLLAACACVGVTTVVPQILLPMAADLVAEDRRGAVTGTLLSGLLAGILLARTFSGVLGAWLGWRATYLVAAGAALVLAAVLSRTMPRTGARSREPYRSLLAAPVRLLGSEPELRRSCTYQVLLFGGFNAAWTALALLVTGPHYRLGTATVGLLALVGAGSILCSQAAGRRVDRTGPDAVNRLCFAGALAAAAVLAIGYLGGVGGLVGLGAGMLLLDVAVQSGQVANQARIFRLPGGLRARRNTAYMTCAFLGGSAGSWIGTRASAGFGWGGVVVLIALAAAIALAGQALTARRRVEVVR
ncbi:MFS transporter [Dactylosporangium matsuzakiense]|uniref:Permease n=1 Tax=Dactylosporangium matsuzakiense TaxID=53360 RepID=A0A9W6KFT7_9ACTN|nr:MFS transporter [Dactylosporangium matsuzakiense]GLK99269.1 permease [Dactylosporangium matsuzakiense]